MKLSLSSFLSSLRVLFVATPALAFAQIESDDKQPPVSTRLDSVKIQGYYGKNYGNQDVSASLRLTSTPLEMPQNIEVIDPEVMKDQIALNLNESVTRNVSGAFREELHNMISPDIYMRGGYISAQRNGVDLRPVVKGPMADDVSYIERIEFVKGPNMYMNSLSEPAGSYNVITKKPTAVRRNNFMLTTGSYGLIRGEADLGGAIDKNKKLMYRVNLMGMHTKTFIQFEEQEKFIVAPSIKWQITKKNSIMLEYIYQRANYSLLSPAQISPNGFKRTAHNFTLTDPDTRPYRSDEHSVFFTFEQKINDNWNFVGKVSNVTSQYNGNIFWVDSASITNKDMLERYLVYDEIAYNVFSAQAFMRGHVTTGPIEHNILFGVDYNDKINNSVNTWNTAGARLYPLSISHPVYTSAVNTNATGGNFASENVADRNDPTYRQDGRITYVSGHVMDELSALDGKLRLSVGVRLTAAWTNFDDYGKKDDSKNVVATPRVGFTYMPIKSLAIYALYDNSFLPQAGISNTGARLRPMRGRNFEVGVKKDWMDGKWNTSLSVYRIDRKNQRFGAHGINTNAFSTGSTYAQGIEFDLRGRLAKGLNVILNYAYTDAKVTSHDQIPDQSLVGAPAPNLIDHIQNLWLVYELPIPRVKGIAVSFGTQYLIGRHERFISLHQTRMDNLFRMDAGLSYTRKKYAIRVLVNNVLNADTYSTAWTSSYDSGREPMYYWVRLAPINFRVSLGVNL